MSTVQTTDSTQAQFMSQAQLIRMESLKQALGHSKTDDSAAEIVARAKQFEAFLSGE